MHTQPFGIRPVTANEQKTFGGMSTATSMSAATNGSIEGSSSRKRPVTAPTSTSGEALTLTRSSEGAGRAMSAKGAAAFEAAERMRSAKAKCREYQQMKISSAEEKRRKRKEKEERLAQEAQDVINAEIAQQRAAAEPAAVMMTSLLAASAATPEEEKAATKFNPRRPSVFAAALMSDQSSLAHRQSSGTSLDAFVSTFAPSSSSMENNRPAPLLAAISESNVDSDISPMSLRSTNIQRQKSDRFKLPPSDSKGGDLRAANLSSKANSFSALPAMEKNPASMQKAKSLKLFT